MQWHNNLGGFNPPFFLSLSISPFYINVTNKSSNMKIILFTLAILQNNKFKLEKHTFNSEDTVDLELLDSYFDDEDVDKDEFSEEEFESVCRAYLYEEEVMAWQQSFHNCIILNNLQVKNLKKLNFNI